jgi:hypothetical protein
LDRDPMKDWASNVAGYASLTYHLNGLVNRISHPNETVDLQGNDPNARWPEPTGAASP